MKTLIICLLVAGWIIFGLESALARTKSLDDKRSKAVTFTRFMFVIFFIILLPFIIVDDLGVLYGEYMWKRTHKK